MSAIIPPAASMPFSSQQNDCQFINQLIGDTEGFNCMLVQRIQYFTYMHFKMPLNNHNLTAELKAVYI